jgi:hypothetical protein
MNALIIAVILVIIFLLIFVMFSLDDHEEEEGFLSDEGEAKKPANKEAEVEAEVEETSLPPIFEKDSFFDAKIDDMQELEIKQVDEAEIMEPVSAAKSELEAEPVVEASPIEPAQPQAEKLVAAQLSEKASEKLVSAQQQPAKAEKTIEQAAALSSELPERLRLASIGGEEDLRFRTSIYERLPIAKDIKKLDCIAAVVQFRLPEELERTPDKFLRMLQRAEKVLEADFSFSFASYNLNQLNRLWLFTPQLEAMASDPLFEAIVVTSEAIIRFKNALRADTALAENKVKIAIGISIGQAFKISHGIANPATWYGNAIYMAEALADTALDLKVYADELIHNEVLPLFDFREWKPVALRANMAPAKMFELVGWTTPDEMVSYANHPEPSARRALAVAFRYLEFLDDKMSVLLTLASDPEEAVRYEALETIKVIANDRTLGMLKYIFPEAKNPEFRAIILDAFGEIGNPEVMPIVLGSTKESNWRVRRSAACTLHRLGGKDSLKNLEALLDDVDDSVRVAVHHIYYKETQNPTYLNSIISLLTNLSKRTRFNAVKALLDLGHDNAIKAIINSFSEQDVEIQRYILRRLEESKSKILYQCLLSLFKTSSEDIRTEIVEVIKRAGI